MTVQHEHVFPAIFHDLIAKMLDQPADSDSVSLVILRRDHEFMRALI